MDSPDAHRPSLLYVFQFNFLSCDFILRFHELERRQVAPRQVGPKFMFNNNKDFFSAYPYLLLKS